MANGPTKTLGLAKFSSNFTGLAVSFFSGYVRRRLDFYTKVSRSLDILQGYGSLEVLIRLFVFINDVFSSLDIEFQ